MDGPEEKLKLSDKIKAVDLRVIDLWDAMGEENQKGLKGEFFILNRYISNVKKQPREIQEHFVITVNEYYNKNWFSLQQHPKLLWQLLCLCSFNGEKTFFHEWIGFKKKDGANTKKINFLAELYPEMKIKEVEMLAELTSDKEITALAKQCGIDDKDIKKKLK